MIDKFCKSCNTTKLLEEFHKNSKSKDGCCIYCKICLNKRGKEWKQNNKQEQKLYMKIYREEHVEQRAEYSKNYHKKIYPLQKDIIIKRVRNYRKENPEKVKQSKKKEQVKNAKKYSERSKIRRQTDLLFKLKGNMRTRTTFAFNRIKINKPCNTKILLKIEWEDLKLFIENKFTEGMSWENYGTWHIDHIIPLDSAKNERELRNLCVYTNLQPLWALDNIKKSNKINESK